MALFDFEFQFLVIQQDLDDLVESKLIPKFKELGQKIFHPSHNDVPGRTKFDNFEKALNSSQNVLLLITNGFLEDKMCSYYTEKIIANKDLDNIFIGIDKSVTEPLMTSLQCLVKFCPQTYTFDSSKRNDQIHGKFLDQIIQSEGFELKANSTRGTQINTEVDIFKDRPPPFPNLYDVSIINSDDDFDAEMSEKLDKLKIFSLIKGASPGKSITQNIIDAMLITKCAILILNDTTIKALSATRLNLIMQIGQCLPISSFIVVDPYDNLEIDELPLDIGNSLKVIKSGQIKDIQNAIISPLSIPN